MLKKLLLVFYNEILKFVEMLEEGKIDKEPKLEGKFLNVIVLPKDKK